MDFCRRQASCVMMGATMVRPDSLKARVHELDARSMELATRWRSPGLDLFFKLFSYSAMGSVWIALAAMFLGLEFLGISIVPEQRQFLAILPSPFLAWGGSNVLKGIFRRSRPAPRFKELDSFPSSHSACAFAIFVAMALIHYPAWPAAGVWAVLVTLSRWYLGMHYPSDLAGGVVLGLLCGQAVRIPF